MVGEAIDPFRDIDVGCVAVVVVVSGSDDDAIVEATANPSNDIVDCCCSVVADVCGVVEREIGEVVVLREVSIVEA